MTSTVHAGSAETVKITESKETNDNFEALINTPAVEMRSLQSHGIASTPMHQDERATEESRQMSNAESYQTVDTSKTGVDHQHIESHNETEKTEGVQGGNECSNKAAVLQNDKLSNTNKKFRLGPVVHITLLLPNGIRHTLQLDEVFLKDRNVSVNTKDPYQISVYTLKELICRDWHDGQFSFYPSNSFESAILIITLRLGTKTIITECSKIDTLRTYAE